MLYHDLRRHSHNNIYSSNQSPSNYESESIQELMPRYHYSRTPSNNATPKSDLFFPRHYSNNQSSKPVMTATTASNNSNNANNNNQYSYGPLKSAFIPLVTNSRTIIPDKREFVEIPIKREDGTSTTNNSIRHLPVQFISETTSLPSNNTTNNNNGNTSPKPLYTNLFRPSSKYSQHYFNNNNEESADNVPHLPSVPRRLSLTIPVMTTKTTKTTKTTTDDDTVKQNIPSSSIRPIPIPIRLSQSLNVASIPTHSSRISSAILRSSPLAYNQLQRQKTDLMDTSSSDFTNTSSSTSPVRRAEVMAREAIQGIFRFQQQQRNGSVSDNTTDRTVPSPLLSRRVIVNLKNNQSVSLDSRISSAQPLSTKPMSSSSRVTQRNNLYHIPVLHEIQIPPHPATLAVENFLQLSRSPSTNNNNNASYKNEFRMEIPVTLITDNDEENRIQPSNDEKEDGITDYDPQITIFTELIPSTNPNSNQALKSILKRSPSRETVSRKNVSFMNA